MWGEKGRKKEKKGERREEEKPKKEVGGIKLEGVIGEAELRYFCLLYLFSSTRRGEQIKRGREERREESPRRVIPSRGCEHKGRDKRESKRVIRRSY